MSENQLNNPIVLAEMKPESILDLINLFLEYFVFFRWIAFKNRPRGNLFLLRSFMIVGVFALIYFKFRSSLQLVMQGVEVDSVLALSAAVVIGFWYSTGVFHKKTSFCMDLYSDIMKEYAHGNRKGAHLLSVNLSATLLTLDLWAHRAFSTLFNKSLEDAINFRFPTAQGQSGEERDAVIKRANRGKLTIREARVLIDNYQAFLLTQVP